MGSTGARITNKDHIVRNCPQVSEIDRPGHLGYHSHTHTPDMRQSKTLLTIDERGSKIARKQSF